MRVPLTADEYKNHLKSTLWSKHTFIFTVNTSNIEEDDTECRRRQHTHSQQIWWEKWTVKNGTDTSTRIHRIYYVLLCSFSSSSCSCAIETYLSCFVGPAQTSNTIWIIRSFFFRKSNIFVGACCFAEYFCFHFFSLFKQMHTMNSQKVSYTVIVSIVRSLFVRNICHRMCGRLGHALCWIFHWK